MQMNLRMELIAPCGIDCGVCKRYLATVRGLHKQKRLPECTGCRPRDKVCGFLKTRCELLAKKQIRFCFECRIFPCDRLQTLNKRYTTKYNTSLIDNLNNIRRYGLELWLQQEIAKWRCPRCGGTVSVHDSTCYDCGFRVTQKSKK